MEPSTQIRPDYTVFTRRQERVKLLGISGAADRESNLSGRHNYRAPVYRVTQLSELVNC